VQRELALGEPLLRRHPVGIALGVGLQRQMKQGGSINRWVNSLSSSVL